MVVLFKNCWSPAPPPCSKEPGNILYNGQKVHGWNVAIHCDNRCGCLFFQMPGWWWDVIGSEACSDVFLATRSKFSHVEKLVHLCSPFVNVSRLSFCNSGSGFSCVFSRISRSTDGIHLHICIYMTKYWKRAWDDSVGLIGLILTAWTFVLIIPFFVWQDVLFLWFEWHV